MRLTTTEQAAITKVFKILITATQSQLFLFGSRTDESKKGGDIDLLIVAPSSKDKETILKERTSLLINLKMAIGDQKIDLVVLEQSELISNPFYQNIASSLLKII